MGENKEYFQVGWGILNFCCTQKRKQCLLIMMPKKDSFLVKNIIFAFFILLEVDFSLEAHAGADTECTDLESHHIDFSVGSSSMLALTWREFDVDLHHGGFTISGLPLKIQERANSGEGTGLIVWDGSIVLAKFLEHNFAFPQLQGKKVLELGAGTGLVGLAAAFLGAENVFLTDLEYTLQNMRANADLNKPNTRNHVDVYELDWLKVSGRNKSEDDDAIKVLRNLSDCDMILAADVVWVEELILPLVASIDKILTSKATMYMSYQSRSLRADTKLFDLMDTHRLDYEEVDRASFHPDFVSKRIKIYKITRRN
mmetsp:Transcript_6493/g.8254  ORF Transcript_6493/g.8254 Transcript_6493/m.8254 type:complete len:313 (-) Transcript_6493:524-1462(-)